MVLDRVRPRDGRAAEESTCRRMWRPPPPVGPSRAAWEAPCGCQRPGAWIASGHQHVGWTMIGLRALFTGLLLASSDVATCGAANAPTMAVNSVEMTGDQDACV